MVTPELAVILMVDIVSVHLELVPVFQAELCLELDEILARSLVSPLLGPALQCAQLSVCIQQVCTVLLKLGKDQVKELVLRFVRQKQYEVQ